MGLHHIVEASTSCTRCGTHGRVQAECYYGAWPGDCLRVLHVGDTYPTGPGEEPLPTADIDGYAECRACSFDFGVRVRVVGGVIRELVPEVNTLVHVRDGVLLAPIECSSCGFGGDAEISLYRGCRDGAYRLGDVYRPTVSSQSAELRGRGSCTRCEATFAVRIDIINDRLSAVRVDAHQLDAPPGVHRFAPENKLAFSLSRG
jgi:hypothetical protein